jgi:thiamine biosynthesis lipoprotein ApbE
MAYPPHLSPALRRQLAVINAAEQAEEDRAEEAREAFAYRCVAMAPGIYEQQQLAAARARFEAARAEDAREQEQAERMSNLSDLRDRLLQTGQGRWRTVAETLAAASGQPY